METSHHALEIYPVPADQVRDAARQFFADAGFKIVQASSSGTKIVAKCGGVGVADKQTSRMMELIIHEISGHTAVSAYHHTISLGPIVGVVFGDLLKDETDKLLAFIRDFCEASANAQGDAIEYCDVSVSDFFALADATDDSASFAQEYSGKQVTWKGIVIHVREKGRTPPYIIAIQLRKPGVSISSDHIYLTLPAEQKTAALALKTGNIIKFTGILTLEAQEVTQPSISADDFEIIKST